MCRLAAKYSMFKVLKEKSIRLAENWSIYRSFRWRLKDLAKYEDLADLQESFDLVNKNLTKSDPKVSRKNIIKAMIELYKYNYLKDSIKKIVYSKSDSQILCNLGFLFLSLKEYKDAKEAFQKSLEVKVNAYAYQGLGWSILKSNNKLFEDLRLGASGIHAIPSYKNYYQALG